MTIEMYRLLDSYKILISRSDDHFYLHAKVYHLDGFDRVFIDYSHTCIPTQEAAGPWYSDSMTKADSREHAKAVIQKFSKKLENAYKIVPWD